MKVEHDIWEVANQLEGFVTSRTPKDLADFLLREGRAAGKLAEEIVRLRESLEAQAARIAELERTNWALSDEMKDRRFVRCGEECYAADDDPNCALEHGFQKEIETLRARGACLEEAAEQGRRAIRTLAFDGANIEHMPDAMIVMLPISVGRIKEARALCVSWEPQS